MKKIIITLAMAVLLSVGCAAMAEQPAKDFSKVTATKDASTIKARIYDNSVELVRLYKKVNDSLQMKEFNVAKENYNKAAKEFNESPVAKSFRAAKKNVDEMPEAKRIDALNKENEALKSRLTQK